MAIDQISESVQRQERPVFSLKDFKNLSIQDHEKIDTSLHPEMDKSFSTSNHFISSKLVNLRASSVSPVLWPPLKSSRYCKKQRLRNTKARGITPSIMLMHESSINHHRVTSALNELSSNNVYSLIQSVSSFNPNSKNLPFWSRKSCQEFWDEYLECEANFSEFIVFDAITPVSKEFSKMNLNSADEAIKNAHLCYTKIKKSIRKLLRRTFSAASTFAELENFIIDLSKSPINNEKDFDYFSCGQVLDISNIGVTVKLETPFHRVWLHAICQYHGLISQSKTVNDDRLVYINFRPENLNTLLSSPKTSLYNYLQNS